MNEAVDKSLETAINDKNNENIADVTCGEIL